MTEKPYYPDQFEEACAREDDDARGDPYGFCGDPECVMDFAPHFRSECHTQEMIEAAEKFAKEIPPIPMVLGKAPRSMSPNHGRKELLKSKREHTPAALAEWLVRLARSCSPQSQRD